MTKWYNFKNETWFNKTEREKNIQVQQKFITNTMYSATLTTNSATLRKSHIHIYTHTDFVWVQVMHLSQIQEQ